jgi:hypothetical protein
MMLVELECRYTINFQPNNLDLLTEKMKFLDVANLKIFGMDFSPPPSPGILALLLGKLFIIKMRPKIIKSYENVYMKLTH